MRSKVTEGPLKYHLRELLKTVPREFSVADVGRVLEAEYGITKASFYGHMNIRVGAVSSLTEEQVAKYAAFFGVTSAEIINYQPVDRKTARSVYDILKTTAPFTQEALEKLTGITVPAGR